MAREQGTGLACEFNRGKPPGCCPRPVGVILSHTCCACLFAQIRFCFLTIDKSMTTRISATTRIAIQCVDGAGRLERRCCSAPPQLAAKSWVLMDAASGSILVDHQAVRACAGQPDQADDIARRRAGTPARPVEGGRRRLISEKAWRMGGSRCSSWSATRSRSRTCCAHHRAIGQ